MLECIHIDKGLRIETNGLCTNCCMQREPFTDSNGNVLNVHNNTFDEIKNSSLAKEIRESLKKGIKHSACYRCWNEEENGIESKRLRDLRYFSNIVSSLTPNKVEPLICDINVGKQCNLKCRTCNPFSSSTWVKEWNDLSDYYKKLGFKYIEYDGFTNDSKFWSEFKKYLDKYIHIDFYGGEPFLVKRLWNLLNYAIKMGFSKNISLHYNTNGSVWDQKKYSILNEFKHVNIDFSIDGIFEKASYIRHPSNWDLILKNFESVLDITRNQPKKFNISICCTISILNIFYIDELIDFFNKQYNFNQIYINILHNPEYYNVQNIPCDIKNKIEEKIKPTLKKYGYDNKAIHFMYGKKFDPEQWEIFLETTKVTDRYRNESFYQTLYEFDKIIKQHGYII